MVIPLPALLSTFLKTYPHMCAMLVGGQQWPWAHLQSTQVVNNSDLALAFKYPWGATAP